MIRHTLFRPATRRAASSLLNNNNNRRKLSTSSSPLDADSGGLATRAHHAMTVALAVGTPLFVILPQESSVGRGLGVLLAGTISAHSWIGLNYVATDYVPKVSKKLLGPARVFNVVLATITFVGLTKMSLSSPGGIKGAIGGLWNPPTKEEEESKK